MSLNLKNYFQNYITKITFVFVNQISSKRNGFKMMLIIIYNDDLFQFQLLLIGLLFTITFSKVIVIKKLDYISYKTYKSYREK